MNDTWRQRAFGNTGLVVSALGFGGGQIGDASMTEEEAARLLNAVLDSGVTLVDTARGYGLSEERIGRHLAHRRGEFVLSTKVGYGISGHEDWTGPIITAGIDEALRLLRTDHIDIVHLHSCPIETLARGDVIAALLEAVDAGKIRVAAYSGDNEALEWAVDSGNFGGIQTSINLFDQRVLDAGVARAAAKGLGVIAKRPVANAPWRFTHRPAGDYCEPYWERMHAMRLDTGGIDWQEFALRFTAWQPGVSACIAGTRNLGHLLKNVAYVAEGPLPDDLAIAARAAFEREDRGWIGQT